MFKRSIFSPGEDEVDEFGELGLENLSAIVFNSCKMEVRRVFGSGKGVGQEKFFHVCGRGPIDGCVNIVFTQAVATI